MGERVTHDDGGVPPQAGVFGEHVAGGASFRCAACDEMAAVVRLVRAGTVVNMGPQLGEQSYDQDGVVVDYWLGTTAWRRLDPVGWARVEAVLTARRPDPGALHAIDWELAPYWCRDCRRCYCRDDWQKTVVWDGPFYDYTDGVCPAGHRYMIDD
jgi:hypothetical protein